MLSFFIAPNRGMFKFVVYFFKQTIYGIEDLYENGR